jgi:hypothetical protein
MCWPLLTLFQLDMKFDHARIRMRDYPYADVSGKLWTITLNHLKEIVISELLNQIQDLVSIGKDHEPCCIYDLSYL